MPRLSKKISPLDAEMTIQINPDSWEHEEMFSFDPKSRAIFSKFKPNDFLDKEVMSLTNDTFIRKTLEHQDIDVAAISCE